MAKAEWRRLDAGPGQPNAILTTARTVALVMRPTIRQVWSALSRVEILTQLGVSSRLALLLTGPGTHSAREVAQALGIPVAAALPDDARSAAMLSDGVGGERSLSSGSLLRSARAAGQALRDHVTDATRQSAREGALR